MTTTMPGLPNQYSGQEDRSLIPGRGSMFFSLRHRAQTGSGAQPPSLGIKQPEREADHSPPYSAEVQNAWSCTSTPQFVFMAWCLVRHRENFTFLP